MMNYTLTLNKDYQGRDRFSVLTCGDKYLMTVNGRRICWVSGTDEAEKLLNDPTSWLNVLMIE